jgi:hypothetical protein
MLISAPLASGAPRWTTSQRLLGMIPSPFTRIGHQQVLWLCAAPVRQRFPLCMREDLSAVRSASAREMPKGDTAAFHAGWWRLRRPVGISRLPTTMPAMIVAPEIAPPTALREHGPPPVRPAAFPALPPLFATRTPGLPATAIKHAVLADAVSCKLSEVFDTLPNLIETVESAQRAIRFAHPARPFLSKVLADLAGLLASFQNIEDSTDAYHAFRVRHPQFRAGKVSILHLLLP